MLDEFKKLLDVERNPETDKKIAEGFAKRQKEREREYEMRAAFNRKLDMNRPYDI